MSDYSMKPKVLQVAYTFKTTHYELFKCIIMYENKKVISGYD